MLRTVAALALAAAWLLLPAPAQAHPFGQPQRVTVAPAPTGVEVSWAADPDDVTALAAFLGVVGGEHVVVFEDGEYDEEQSSVPAGIRLAESADVLASYLLEHVRVSAGDRDCTGELRPVEDVTVSGATLAFDCGGPVADADIAISTLTDLDPAYRTLATGPGGQRRAYSVDEGTASWTLPGASGEDDSDGTDGGSAGRSAVVQLGAVGGAGALLAGVAWVLRRRVVSSRGRGPFTVR